MKAKTIAYICNHKDGRVKLFIEEPASPMWESSELVLRHEAQAEIDALKAENANLEFLLQHVIGDHCAPNDCYATGPLTGNPIADLVSCPSCAALDYLASKEKK